MVQSSGLRAKLIGSLCSFSRLSFRTSIQISKCLCFQLCRNENALTHILKLCIARRLMWKCQERDILRIDHTKSKRKAPITTYIELADKRHYDYKRDQVSQQPLQTAFTHSHLALFHQYLIHYSRGKSKTLTK